MSTTSKRNRKKQLISKLDNDSNSTETFDYIITSEPIPHRSFRRLPRRVKDEMEALYEKAQTHPHQVIPRLLELIEKYPKVPQLYNYLGMAYSWTDDRAKAEEVIQQNYDQNPDYLFARLNYAELYLVKGEYDQIAEIFEHKFDLKQLYPKRDRFHISEFANFTGLIAIYFLETGERDIAEEYFSTLEEVAPEYPMTKMLGRRLSPSFIGRIVKRIRRR